MNDYTLLLTKAKQSRNAGIIIARDHPAKPMADSLATDRYLRSERVLDSGRNPDDAEKIVYRYYITGKGAKRLGFQGSCVEDILLRGGSSPVGFDRDHRQVEHRDGVFLSRSPEIAKYFATRFSSKTSIVQECMVALHTMATINGEGKTSKELKLNSLRHKYINEVDGIKIVDMHMGHINDMGVRHLTAEHVSHRVPELATVYIVFHTYDVYPLDTTPVVADVDKMAREVEQAGCATCSDVDNLTIPRFA